MFNIARNIAGDIASNITRLDDCFSHNFVAGMCCWKLAQRGRVSNTVVSNIAGNIARCGRPLNVAHHMKGMILDVSVNKFSEQ